MCPSGMASQEMVSMQAGVNCGVHCKCDECHNTVEDGLPPPPRPSGKQSASASANALTVVANPTDRNKTSPGTPPAPCALSTLLSMSFWPVC